MSDPFLLLSSCLPSGLTNGPLAPARGLTAISQDHQASQASPPSQTSSMVAASKSQHRFCENVSGGID